MPPLPAGLSTGHWRWGESQVCSDGGSAVRGGRVLGRGWWGGVGLGPSWDGRKCGPGPGRQGCPSEPRCPPAPAPGRSHWGHIPRTGWWPEACLSPGDMRWVPDPGEAPAGEVPPTLSTSPWRPSPDGEGASGSSATFSLAQGPLRVGPCLKHTGPRAWGRSWPKETIQGLAPPRSVWDFYVGGSSLSGRGVLVMCRHPPRGPLVATRPWSLLGWRFGGRGENPRGLS